MPFCRPAILSCRSLVLLSIIAALVFVIGFNTAKSQILEVAVGDVVGNPGEQGSVIPTYLTNPEDEIVAFEMWLILEHSELMSFQTEQVVTVDTTWWKCIEYVGEICSVAIPASSVPTYWVCLATDTVAPFDCLDSVRVSENEPYDWMNPVDTTYSVITIDTVVAGGIDTVGTLLSGWERVVTRSYLPNSDSSKYYDVKIVAQANANWEDGFHTPGIPAGRVSGVLFNLLADIDEIDDTVSQRSVSINILTTPADNFVFARPDGSVIGLAYNEILDSNFYRCDAWDNDATPPECLEWTRVSGPPWDSVVVYEASLLYLDTMTIDTVTGLPTGQVAITHGQMRVINVCCGKFISGLTGNTDCDSEGKRNLADITRLIDNVYISKLVLCCQENGNTDGDVLSKINLADITRLIDHVYISKAETATCQ